MNNIKESWRRIAVLEKRLKWLRNRIDNTEGDLTYDKAEASALEWAIPILISVRDELVKQYKEGKSA